MERFLAILGRCNKAICASCLGIMVLVTFANTALRYLFHTSIIQAEELTRYLFVWCIFLAVISVYHERRHIAVTTLVDRFKGRTLHIFNFIWGFAAVFALGVLLQGSCMYFQETTTMGQATGLPYKFVVAPVMLASFCCLCIVITDMIKDLRAFLRGDA